MCLRSNFALLFALLCSFLPYANAQFRIKNGQDIEIEESLHSVAIFRIVFYICAGAIVNVNTVVTAAHCLKDVEQDELVLIAGIADLDNRGSGQTRNVQCIHYGTGYDEETHFMDIAVVKVEKSFDEDSVVPISPISLCDYRLEPGMTIQVSAWGRISETSRGYSNQLKTKYVDIVKTQECKTGYARVCSVHLSETIICAESGVCFGDSGAAGVRNGQLCAVVQGFSSSNLPDKYTDVTNERVRDFIRSKM
ncbi:trypsin alpha-like [Eurosta solidaginis]|uniref:trypsin alpha-like n=1 Tax=Eurosta solidaginis TaxID=178769 RepID=UPI0035310C16